MSEKRFDAFLERHFGVGIRWCESGRYSFTVSISILCVTLAIGIGKAQY